MSSDQESLPCPTCGSLTAKAHFSFWCDKCHQWRTYPIYARTEIDLRARIAKLEKELAEIKEVS
ncbi:MAG TPA: hypothetical protein VL854_03530 [Nitrososphaeraceae archaeon]|nr:hypothetical protein [Nitrososphaeraceae archaeon]